MLVNVVLRVETQKGAAFVAGEAYVVHSEIVILDLEFVQALERVAV